MGGESGKKKNKDKKSSPRKKKSPEKPEQEKRILKTVSRSPRLTQFATDDLPERFQVYVSREIWAGWSPIRRESFAQIVDNPNAFFYRNRPPGDPQKFGPFTPDEESQFLERVAYFRTLGIHAGLWGLFAVPIRGRLGYQCSNFYRLLVNDGKIKDTHYDVLPHGKLQFKHGTRVNDAEVLEVLEKEAFDFISQCLQSENGEVPMVSRPIRVDGDRPVRVRTPRPLRKPADELTHFFGRSRGLPVRKLPAVHALEMSAGAKGWQSGKRKERAGGADGRVRCPLYGAMDPVSGQPMEVPMMDESGFVMDLASWRKVFREDESPPPGTLAQGEADLVELTASNFDEFKLQITNVPC
jgi:hypothetical protein